MRQQETLQGSGAGSARVKSAFQKGDVWEKPTEEALRSIREMAMWASKKGGPHEGEGCGLGRTRDMWRQRGDNGPLSGCVELEMVGDFQGEMLGNGRCREIIDPTEIIIGPLGAD